MSTETTKYLAQKAYQRRNRDSQRCRACGKSLPNNDYTRCEDCRQRKYKSKVRPKEADLVKLGFELIDREDWGEEGKPEILAIWRRSITIYWNSYKLSTFLTYIDNNRNISLLLYDPKDNEIEFNVKSSFDIARVIQLIQV